MASQAQLEPPWQRVNLNVCRVINKSNFNLIHKNPVYINLSNRYAILPDYAVDPPTTLPPH